MNDDLRAAAQRAEDYLGWLERDDPAERSLFTEPGIFEDFHALASSDRILGLLDALDAAEYTLNWAIGDSDGERTWVEEAQEALEKVRAALEARASAPSSMTGGVQSEKGRQR